MQMMTGQSVIATVPDQKPDLYEAAVTSEVEPAAFQAILIAG